MAVSPYAYPGLKFNYLTEDQKKELFRNLPSYKIALITKESIALYFNITVEDLEGKSQKGILPWARHLFCFLAKELTHFSDRELGYLIKRDRSTVSTSIKDVKANIESYTEYRDQVVDLRMLLKSKIGEAKYSFNKEAIKVNNTHPV